MKVRILRDEVEAGDLAEPIEPGTVVEATIDPEFGDAWYNHPANGYPWFSYPGDFEEV